MADPQAQSFIDQPFDEKREYVQMRVFISNIFRWDRWPNKFHFWKWKLWGPFSEGDVFKVECTQCSPQLFTPVTFCLLCPQVEIHPGTGVTVDRLEWAYAQNAPKATVFVRQLLVAIFPVEVLLVSNLRGGHDRDALDKTKVDAIYGIISALVFYLWGFPSVSHVFQNVFVLCSFFLFVGATLDKYPGTSPTTIGAAINAKITELRNKNKPAQHRATVLSQSN